MNRKFALVATALACAVFVVQAAAAQELVVEEGLMDVRIHGAAAKLDTLVVKRADLPGRLPVALITHGVARSAQEFAAVRSSGMMPQAREMALRGYLAVAIVRRGFGSSSPQTANLGGCSTGSFLPTLRNSASEVESVLTSVRERPDADGEIVVGLGMSVGGMTMLALTESAPKGLKAVVNVSGTIGAVAHGINCNEAALVSAGATFGRAAKHPSLWLYAENDGYIGPVPAQRLYDAYRQNGAATVFAMFPPVGNDGHFIWSSFEGREKWLPELDKFLRANGLPTWSAADAGKVARILGLDPERGLARYLGAPGHKALVASADGKIVRYWSGNPTMEAARAGALDLCVKASGTGCRIVMENFQAVAR